MHSKRDAHGTAMRLADPEDARRAFAAACVAAHEEREWHLLLLATSAPDDESAQHLEVRADDAYRDAMAVAQEHELEV